jgi:DNA replication and repair protein RecF
MWVQALSLTNFRSYEQADIEFTPGVTTFIGMNGQGKTNIVEAIGFLATLGSHRVAQDAPLVRSGAAHAVIRARVLEGGIDTHQEGADHDRGDHEGVGEQRFVTVDVQINPSGSNKARINRSAATRARDILGIIRAIVFAPEDLSLVRGDPSDRRRFLDEMSIQRHPRIAGVRADYDKVLRQRNALVKSAGGRATASIKETLAAWDEQLIDLGVDIITTRRQLMADLLPHIREAYVRIAETATVDAHYRPSSPRVREAVGGDSREQVAEAFRADLAERFDDEIRRGITLVGPHRDEVDLFLDELPLKGYASHGESWSMALALRLAAAQVLRADGVDPIIVLDDVFAELDSPRRAHLADMVGSSTQVFITAAVAADVPGELTGARFEVSKGQVRAA